MFKEGELLCIYLIIKYLLKLGEKFSSSKVNTDT